MPSSVSAFTHHTSAGCSNLTNQAVTSHSGLQSAAAAAAAAHISLPAQLLPQVRVIIYCICFCDIYTHKVTTTASYQTARVIAPPTAHLTNILPRNKI